MTLPLLLLLLIVGLGVWCTHYKKTAKTILYVTIFLFFFIGSGWAPSLLLRNLVSAYAPLENPQWDKRNAIIVLGAGTAKYPDTSNVMPSLFSFPRIVETARLYYLCKQSKNVCEIITSGGDPLKNGKTEAEVFQNTLINLGVNSGDIILEAKSNNTYQNAEFVKAILKDESFDRIYLVTSSLHMKRSLLYFSNFSINPTPDPADILAVKISLMPCAYNFTMMDFALHEYEGIMRFYIYNRMGWNS